MALAVLAAAVGAERAGGAELPEATGDLIAGLALLAGGGVAWARRPGSRSGPLLALAGVAWFAGSLDAALLYAHRGPLVHVLLAFPSGRLSRRVPAAIVAAAYVDGFVPELARSDWPTLGLMTAVVGAAGWRYRAAGGIERRARAAALAGAVGVGGTLTFAAVARLADAHADTAALWAFEIAVSATAVGLAADLLWGRWAHAAVTGLVVDLGDHHEPQALRAALARALGDPGLEVAYYAGDRPERWVDEAGQPVRLPEGDDAGRAVTLIREEDEPVAALVHDPSALADRELLSSAAAATRLAVANVRLQAEVAAGLREVAASRRRLVEAGDDERRRLGEQLRTGAERRLVEVVQRVSSLAATRDGDVATSLRRLGGELDGARSDLLRFAQGIHPRTLTDGGLRPALTELAAQAAVPVHVQVPDGRFPRAQEAAVFFVCSEGLANVAKYASASRVDIVVSAPGPRLMVRVVDDGRGGADPARGSGLRGLTDRVEALGGTLHVSGSTGAGTRLEAQLPISPGELQ